MRYMMFVVTDPGGGAEAESAGNDLSIDEWLAEAGERWVTGDALSPPADATTVCRHGSEVLVTAGPATHSRELIVGFDILDCGDLDEAITLAARHPQANGGKLELRPFAMPDA